MQEPHRTHSQGRDDDTTPIQAPSSPLSTAFHRHHPQPNPTPTGEDTDPFLRRRPTATRQPSEPGSSSSRSTGVTTRPKIASENASASQAAAGSSAMAVSRDDTVLLSIATPFNDIGGSKRKPGRRIPRSTTVLKIKEDLASGLWEGEEWERERMRLVWQGRIIRDEELVGDVVGPPRNPDETHTFHLVARRKPGSDRPPINLPNATAPHSSGSAPPPPPVPAASSSAVQSESVDSSHLALKDTIHFLLFMARHHLFILLGKTPLKWDDTTPPPAIDQDRARSAVMTVVKTLTSVQGDDVWSECQKAFEEDLERMWESFGRAGMESEVKLVWETAVGRAWRDRDEGDTVPVEIDGSVSELHVPPLSTLSPRTLCHLLQYLRITSLLPPLNHMLENAMAPRRPTPTTTMIRVESPAGNPPQDTYRYAFRIHVRIPSVSLGLLSHVVFSAIKIGAMIWMMSQGMGWDDARLWIITGGALGWWLGDALNELRREQARNGPPVAPAAPPAGQGQDAQAHADGAENLQAGLNGGVPNLRLQADAPRHWTRAARRTPAGPRGIIGLFMRDIPQIHLDTDARQLHLDSQPSNPPLSRPRRWITQFLLPVALWFITLIPDWEATRARAIRSRERSMRVLVGEMSTAPSPVQETAPLPSMDQDSTSAATGGTPEGGGGATAGVGAAVGLGAGLRRNVVRVYPPGLNEVAKRYYERVMDRGEGIDWEEEREAQRAMGIGEEGEEGGAADQGGMRMGML